MEKQTIKVECTWPHEDITVELNGQSFILYEDPKHHKPPRGDWRHGFVEKGSFSLTYSQAKELGYKLLQAATQAQTLDEGYNEEMKKGRIKT